MSQKERTERWSGIKCPHVMSRSMQHSLADNCLNPVNGILHLHTFANDGLDQRRKAMCLISFAELSCNTAGGPGEWTSEVGAFLGVNKVSLRKQIDGVSPCRFWPSHRAPEDGGGRSLQLVMKTQECLNISPYRTRAVPRAMINHWKNTVMTWR